MIVLGAYGEIVFSHTTIISDFLLVSLEIAPSVSGILYYDNGWWGTSRDKDDRDNKTPKKCFKESGG